MPQKHVCTLFDATLVTASALRRPVYSRIIIRILLLYYYARENIALRLCLGAFRTSPASSMCVQANEPPLYIRRRMLTIQYSLRLGSSPSNPAYNTVFNPKFKVSFSSKPIIRSQHWASALHQNLKKLVLSVILYLGYVFQPLLHGC